MLAELADALERQHAELRLVAVHAPALELLRRSRLVERLGTRGVAPTAAAGVRGLAARG